MTFQEVDTDLQVRDVGGGQFEVAENAAVREHQMQLVAEDGLFLGAAVANGGPSRFPLDGPTLEPSRPA